MRKAARRTTVLVALTLVALTLVTLSGCKPSKRARCEKLVGDFALVVERMAKALGGAAGMTAVERAAAIDKCVATPDDELQCSMNPEASKDPRCVELARKQPRVEWDVATVVDGKVTAKVPKGWAHKSFMGDSYEPPDTSRISYRIADSCGGNCVARSAAEWEQLIVEETPTRRGAYVNVRKDLKPNPTTRVIVTDRGDDAKNLEVLFWHEGATFFVRCEARLDMPYLLDLASFEEACLATTVTWEKKR